MEGIEKFFKKRLQDNIQKETDWNLPDEMLWEAAKVHFPKREPRRWMFIMFLFSSVALFMGLFFIAFKNDFRIISHPNNKTTTIEYSLSSPLSKTISSDETETKENEAREVEEEHQPISDKSIESKQEESWRDASFLEDELVASKQQVLNTNPFQSPGMVFLSERFVKTQTTEVSNESATMAKEEKEIAQELGLKNRALEFLEKCPEIEHLLLKSDLSSYVIGSENLINPSNSFCSWEIGLSHAAFIFNPLKELEQQALESQNIQAKSTYTNLNLPITYRFSKRSSLSSGIYMSRINTDFNFRESDVLDADVSQDDLRRVLIEATSVGSLTLNESDTSNIGIDFLPGVNLERGDSILLEGRIPLRLKILQIPFVYNRHWQVGKFEFLAHAGFSVDFFNASISELDLNIYKQNQPIVRQINFNSLNDNFTEFTLLLGAGMRYSLRRGLSVGLSTKFDATAIEFSRLELGVYYRM